MRQELRSAFCNARFWIALVAMTICLFGFSLPEWLTRIAQGDRMYMDAVSLGFAPIFFGGAILLFPFCAALPYATSQVDDIRTGFMFTKGIRTTTVKYMRNKVIAVALSGAAVMGIACLIHSVTWNIVAGPYDPIANPDNEVVFSPGTVYATLMLSPYGWQAFVHAILGFAITGAVWSVVGLATSVWIPDNLLAITVPVALYFFWQYQLLYPMLGIRLPSLSGLYNDGQLWERYYAVVAVNLLIFATAAFVYYKGMKRRLQNA